MEPALRDPKAFLSKTGTFHTANSDSWSMVMTQKARGITSLLYASTGHTLFPGLYYITGPYVFHLPTGSLPAKYPTGYRFFARPCPKRPRHGFVESRRVRTPEEAVRIYLEEVLPEDPEGELIVMPALTGRFSAVATNAGISWGKGNDGVTSGSGGLTIPASTNRNTWNMMWKKRMMWSWDPHIVEDTTYAEIVENNFRATAVQLRDGPEPPTTLDYIPREETVRLVLGKSGDLLEWEGYLKRVVKGNKGPEGLCFAAYGEPLSSHYAVHAIELEIPVITTRYVTVGDKLTPLPNTTPRLSKLDLRRLRAKVLHWLGREFIPLSGEGYSSQKAILATSIATIHAQSQWDGSPHLLNLRAMAMVTLLRYTAAASLGEVRHWRGNGPGRWGKKRRSTLVGRYGEKLRERTQIYSHFYRVRPLDEILEYLDTAKQDFSTRGWGRGKGRRNDGCGYGGPRWAAVANTGIVLGRALRQFLKTPTPAYWRRCVMAANNLIHTAHNNGYFFNKWLGGDAFDIFAAAPGIGFCNSWAGIVALGLDITLPESESYHSYAPEYPDKEPEEEAEVRITQDDDDDEEKESPNEQPSEPAPVLAKLPKGVHAFTLDEVLTALTTSGGDRPDDYSSSTPF